MPRQAPAVRLSWAQLCWWKDRAAFRVQELRCCPADNSSVPSVSAHGWPRASLSSILLSPCCISVVCTQRLEEMDYKVTAQTDGGLCQNPSRSSWVPCHMRVPVPEKSLQSPGTPCSRWPRLNSEFPRFLCSSRFELDSLMLLQSSPFDGWK